MVRGYFKLKRGNPKLSGGNAIMIELLKYYTCRCDVRDARLNKSESIIMLNVRRYFSILSEVVI